MQTSEYRGPVATSVSDLFAFRIGRSALARSGLVRYVPVANPSRSASPSRPRRGQENRLEFVGQSLRHRQRHPLGSVQIAAMKYKDQRMAPGHEVIRAQQIRAMIKFACGLY